MNNQSIKEEWEKLSPERKKLEIIRIIFLIIGYLTIMLLKLPLKTYTWLLAALFSLAQIYFNKLDNRENKPTISFFIITTIAFIGMLII